ncbi:MAG TPA: hypothetical protein DCL75_05105 [Ktedonobacter sp.]|jgi:putative transposase|nr:hypothetical protein [Ktedonobacter sp.]HAG98239.1 hypothetical protein [Ktedonobacter sp.]HCJ36211.1 hypothetical protein [Ktedonobacter sp.]
MLKTFKYRIFPTKKQLKNLETTLDECRWLYNHLLEMRKTAYEQDRDLNASLNILRLGLQSLGLALEAPAFTHGE